MSSRAFIRFAGILLIGTCLVFLPAQAQEKRAAFDQAKRIAYVVKHGSAKDLATVLGKHFQGDAEVEVLPEPNSNCLLIRANPGAFDDVLKTLQMLDRRPRLVTVEVWVADVVNKPAEKGAEAKPADIDEKALTGPADAVLAQLRQLQRKGQLGSLKRLQTAVAENQSANIMEGETKPVVVGSTVTGTGLVSRQITYRNTGTNARCTPRVADDRTVMLELKVEDARLHVPPDGAIVGEGEKEPIRATEMILASYTGTVTVAPGRAVLLRDVKVDTKTAGPARTLVVVTARVVDENAKPGDNEVRPPRGDEPPPPRDRGPRPPRGGDFGRGRPGGSDPDKP